MDALSIGIVSTCSLTGLGVATYASLKGWAAYLDFRKMELASHGDVVDLAPTAGRIEMADLRERVRKLEAIANGIDL